MEEMSAAQSAIRKFDAFYTELEPDERWIIGVIVSFSLQRAKQAQGESDWLEDEAEVLFEVITPEFAPTILTELGTVVAGQMAPSKSEKRTLD